MAIRTNAPIQVSENVFDEVAFTFDEKAKEKVGSYHEYSILQLEELLKKIIEKEDYESAVRIKEVIEKRKGNH